MSVKTAPLGSLCQMKHGGTPSKANPAYWEGQIPWVSPKDMKSASIDRTDDHISAEAVANSATSIVHKGTILVVVRSGILAHTFPIATVTGPTAFNQDIKALIPNEELVDPDYLYWFVRSSAPLVLRQGVKKGATVHSLLAGFLENLQVPLHPRSAQRRIVDLLSRAEGIVRLRREAKEKTAAIIPALLIDMFGDPVNNPKGWPVVALEEALRAVDYGSSTKASESGVGLPLIRMGNVTYAGDLALSDLKYVELEPVEADRFRLESGDLLFNRTNSKELVGKTGLWDGEFDAVAASYFIRLRTNEDKARPFYLWAFMNSRHMKRVLFDTARGAIGQANINSKELKAFRLPLPPLNEQCRFEERCRSILGIVAQQSYALTKAEATFQSLLARTFSRKLAAAEAVPEEAAVA